MQKNPKNWQVFSSLRVFVVAIVAFAVAAFAASVGTVFVLLRVLMPSPSPFTEDPVVLEIIPLADGWQRFVTNELEISLPSSYKSSIPKEVVKELNEQSEDLTMKSRARLKVNSWFSHKFSFMAGDSEGGRSGFMTNLIIHRHQVVSALKPEQALRLSVDFLGEEVIERKAMTIAQKSGIEIVVYSSVEDLEILSLRAATKVMDTLWIIEYSTTVEEFDSRRAKFERSLSSFRPRNSSGAP